jgi:hypothetical protein
MTEQASGVGIDGDDSPKDFGAYPVDSLLIRTDQRTVHDVLRRENQGFFILDPEFQRAFVWEPERQSRLVESLLMRIPLPVFYLAENSDGKLVVVDGLQRLSTLKRFVDGELALALENPELKGKKFADLPLKLQNRVEDAQLMLYIIDSKVPERVRLDIFDRVNSGRPITRQQMRNALYQGPATQFLRDVSRENDFLEATGKSLDANEMRDREAINRFCAFHLLGWRSYPDDMDEFLATALKQMNAMRPERLAEMRRDFLASMRLNRAIFGKHAFRKHAPDQDGRSVLNLSLFDVFSEAFAGHPEGAIEAKREAIRSGFFQLMSDADFVRDITYATNGKKRVFGRFERVQSLIEGALA